MVLTKKVKNYIEGFRHLPFMVYVEAGRVPTTELVNRIFSFSEIYSGITMFPYQEQFSKRVVRSVLENDGEEITALFSRQAGKSECISVTVGGLMIILPQLANMPMFADDSRLNMFKDGFWVGVFAPSLRQSQITYGRIKKRLQCKTAMAVLNDAEFRLSFDTSNGQTCVLSNGSFATSISASDNSNIEGESFKLIICEEAQDISNFKILKSIHPMGAAYNATIVKIGTPTTFKGNFYDAIQRNKALDAQKSSHIRNHFEYGWKVAAKYNQKYLKYVEKEKKRLGENSDEFNMSYNLKWIIERSMFVDIEKFEKNNGEYNLDTVEYDKKSNHIAGIDLGGKGDDTVVTIVEVDWSMPVIMESHFNDETQQEEMYVAYITYLVGWFRIQNEPDYEEQYALVMDYLSHFRLSRVICDATREAAFAHRLQANLSCEVIPYILTVKSKSEVFKCLDREISSLRARVAMGEYTRKTGLYHDFMNQLGDLQKGWNGAHMVVAHPEERGAHDDFPDSWALAVWGSTFEGIANDTETHSNNRFTEKSKDESQNCRLRNRTTARRKR